MTVNEIYFDKLDIKNKSLVLLDIIDCSLIEGRRTSSSINFAISMLYEYDSDIRDFDIYIYVILRYYLINTSASMLNLITQLLQKKEDRKAFEVIRDNYISVGSYIDAARKRLLHDL